MPVFEISSRIAQATAPPKKPRVRIPYQWSFVIRLLVGLNIAGFTFGFIVVRYGGALTIFGISSIVFLLLPGLAKAKSILPGSAVCSLPSFPRSRRHYRWRRWCGRSKYRCVNVNASSRSCEPPA